MKPISHSNKNPTAEESNAHDGGSQIPSSALESEREPPLPTSADPEELRARRLVAETLEKDDIACLYTLEYKDLLYLTL